MKYTAALTALLIALAQAAPAPAPAPLLDQAKHIVVPLPANDDFTLTERSPLLHPRQGRCDWASCNAQFNSCVRSCSSLTNGDW